MRSPPLHPGPFQTAKLPPLIFGSGRLPEVAELARGNGTKV